MNSIEEPQIGPAEALDRWEEALVMEEAARERVEEAEFSVKATRNDKKKQAFALDELAEAKRDHEKTKEALKKAQTVLSAASSKASQRPQTEGTTSAMNSNLELKEEESKEEAAAETQPQPSQTQQPPAKGSKSKEQKKEKAFVAKPESVHFADFQPGETYTQQVTLTNTSTAANAIKQQAELGQSIKDCLKVTISSPPRVAAGASCSVTLEFIPKTNEDITDIVSIPCDGGHVDITVECTTKKTVPVVSTSLLDFSNVAAGGSKTLVCVLANQGAMTSSFSLRSTTVQEASEGGTSFSFPRGGELQPFSETPIEVVFAPKIANSNFTQKILIDFSEASAHPIEIQLQGNSVDLPIFIDSPVVDFKVCCVDELYREALVINNRGKTALRVAVELPKEVSRELQPQPMVAFVQAGSSQAISLKLRPSLALLKFRRTALPKLGEEWKLENAIEINGILSVPGQTLPVPFCIRAQISETTLQIDPKSIDFGRIPLDSSASVIMKVTNPAIVPQKIGFLSTPGEIQISPANGFCTLAPHETLALKVVMSPREAGEHSFSLACSTLRKKIDIPCRALAVSLPVRFQQPILHLAPFAPGGAPQSHSVFLENVSATAQALEIIPPPGSFLNVEPTNVVLASKQKVRVKVNLWSPRPEAMPALQPVTSHSIASTVSSIITTQIQGKRQQRTRTKKPTQSEQKQASEKDKQSTEREKEATQQAITASAGTSPGETTQSGGGSQSARHYIATATVPSEGVWLVPCYIRGNQDCALLEVHTCFRQAPLSVSDPQPIDFGKVPAAQHSDKVVEVKNLSSETLRLTIDPLDDSFVMLRGPKRPLKPGECIPIVIRFIPRPGHHNYNDVLKIHEHWHCVEIPLKGECVEPEVSVTPDSTRLSLGPVMSGVVATSELTIKNNSAFSVVFRTDLRRLGAFCFSHSNPFSVGPNKGTLGPGASSTIQIKFSPDHERELFHDILDISIEGSDIRKAIHLEGCCTGQRGMFVIGPRVNRLQEEGKLVTEDMAKWLESDLQGVQQIQETRTFEIILQRARNCGESAEEEEEEETKESTGQVIIGNAQPPPDKKPVQGELIIEPLSQNAIQEGFSVEWTKTPIDPGTQKPLIFKYIPPPQQRTATISGQRTEATVLCTMKGGYTANEKNDGTRFTINLVVLSK